MKDLQECDNINTIVRISEMEGDFLSCHDIGRGMAAVGREVLRLYDEGKYDLATAKQLLLATLKGVNWCDGNSYEAAASLAFRCASCLKASDSPKRDLIFGERYFLNESGIYEEDGLDSEDAIFVQSLYMDDKLMAPQLCEECLKVFRQS